MCSSDLNITTANSSVSGTPTTGALAMSDLENWANNIFDMAYDPQSGMERLVFVGRTAHVIINKIARANINTIDAMITAFPTEI